MPRMPVVRNRLELRRPALAPVLALLAAGLLAGCDSLPELPDVPKPDLSGIPGVYKIDIQQGNVVTREQVEQLEIGMSPTKVRFLLGTPLIEDTFVTGRWDYFFSLSEGGDDPDVRRVSVFFVDEALARVDVEGELPSDGGDQRERIVDVPRQRDDGTIFGGLFGGDDDIILELPEESEDGAGSDGGATDEGVVEGGRLEPGATGTDAGSATNGTGSGAPGTAATAATAQADRVEQSGRPAAAEGADAGETDDERGFFSRLFGGDDD